MGLPGRVPVLMRRVESGSDGGIRLIAPVSFATNRCEASFEYSSIIRGRLARRMQLPLRQKPEIRRVSLR